MDVASLIHWPIFLPINLLPSSYSSTHNTGRYHGPHVLGGGFPPPCFVSYVRATTQTAIHFQRLPIPEHNMVDLHAHKYGRFMPSQLTRSVSTQIIPVGIFFAHPVGVFLLKPGRDYLLLYFIIPTGIILVRTKLTRPGLSSFKKIAPTGFLSCLPSTLSPFCTRPSPLFPCITNFKVAPVTLCYTLHFRNWLFFGSSHAYNMKYRSGSC